MSGEERYPAVTAQQWQMFQARTYRRILEPEAFRTYWQQKHEAPPMASSPPPPPVLRRQPGRIRPNSRTTVLPPLLVFHMMMADSPWTTEPALL